MQIKPTTSEGEEVIGAKNEPIKLVMTRVSMIIYCVNCNVSYKLVAGYTFTAPTSQPFNFRPQVYRSFTECVTCTYDGVRQPSWACPIPNIWEQMAVGVVSPHLK